MNDWSPPTGGLLNENASGCLTGIAVGDSLGSPAKIPSSGDVSDHYGIREDAGQLSPRELEPGNTTDDTAQSIALAESIIACRGFVPSDFAQRLVEWYGRQPRGVGAHTAKVLNLVSEGEDWEKAALEVQIADPTAAGNGSLMRCAPIALLDYTSPAVLIENSRLSSRVTHPHSHCQWSCAFINLVIAELLGGTIPIKAVDNALATCAHRGDVNHDVIERVRLASIHGSLDYLQPTAFVLDTLECSLWCLLHTDDFEAAITTAISLGGDTDTIGAVTGALAGAAYGLESIPSRWLDRLPVSALLEDLAVALVGIC